MNSKLKYDPNEVDILVQRARGESVEQVTYYSKFTPEQAADELVKRFSNLTKGIIRICTTGRYYVRAGSQVTFLKLFASPKTPLENVAVAIYKECKVFGPEFLATLGDLAVRQAIQISKTNLSRTILICMKELIAAEIKNNQDNTHVGLDLVPETKDDGSFQKMEMWVRIMDAASGLTEDQQEELYEFLMGQKEQLSEEVAIVLRAYYSEE
jgi:hypothetical protein